MKHHTLGDLGRGIRRTPGAVKALELRVGERVTIPFEQVFGPFVDWRTYYAPRATVTHIGETSITIDAQPARLPGDATG